MGFWMGFLDGVFGWGFWMGFLDGVFGWGFWMGFLDGVFGWGFWMGFLDGVFGWGFWMGFLDGVFGWGFWLCWQWRGIPCVGFHEDWGGAWVSGSVGSGRSSLCIFLCCVRCGWSLLEMWEICGCVCSEDVFLVYFLLKSGICL